MRGSKMSDRTFKPKISEDGTILAGGMRIGEIRGVDWVFDDRYLDRCQARGTPDVPVTLYDLVEALIDHFDGLDNG